MLFSNCFCNNIVNNEMSCFLTGSIRSNEFLVVPLACVSLMQKSSKMLDLGRNRLSVVRVVTFKEFVQCLSKVRGVYARNCFSKMTRNCNNSLLAIALTPFSLPVRKACIAA